MTAVLETPVRPVARRARPRRYLMCPPEYFAVDYAINPWMDPTRPVDTARARQQWDGLRRTYLDLGHTVEAIPPLPGLPDMVFAANGGVVVDGVALSARFAHPERAAEGPAYRDRLRMLGLRVVQARQVNEGEGDVAPIGDVLLAGTGFRTTPEAHAEIAAVFGRPVVSLRLVNPRFYHLDTALAVLDEETIAYLPEAFDAASRAELERRFPDAIRATEADAVVLGLNAVSDGRHVVLAEQATGLAAQLRERGFTPVGVDLSELLKAGGGAKCCTLEIRARDADCG
jgi:N-dimethylarginine dimethylaminohydrolase